MKGVRVFAAVPFPSNHCVAKHGYTRTEQGRHLTAPTKPGEMLLTIGIPESPSNEWVCDTDVIFPVIAVGDHVIDHAQFIPYVCRHQIVAGD